MSCNPYAGPRRHDPHTRQHALANVTRKPPPALHMPKCPLHEQRWGTVAPGRRIRRAPPLAPPTHRKGTNEPTPGSGNTRLHASPAWAATNVEACVLPRPGQTLRNARTGRHGQCETRASIVRAPSLNVNVVMQSSHRRPAARSTHPTARLAQRNPQTTTGPSHDKMPLT